MSNQEVTKLRTRCMVTVIGSRWENPGYTLLEAMLQGCPVVCTEPVDARNTLCMGLQAGLRVLGIQALLPKKSWQ